MVFYSIYTLKLLVIFFLLYRLLYVHLCAGFICLHVVRRRSFSFVSMFQSVTLHTPAGAKTFSRCMYNMRSTQSAEALRSNVSSSRFWPPFPFSFFCVCFADTYTCATMQRIARVAWNTICKIVVIFDIRWTNSSLISRLLRPYFAVAARKNLISRCWPATLLTTVTTPVAIIQKADSHAHGAVLRLRAALFDANIAIGTQMENRGLWCLLALLALLFWHRRRTLPSLPPCSCGIHALQQPDIAKRTPAPQPSTPLTHCRSLSFPLLAPVALLPAAVAPVRVSGNEQLKKFYLMCGKYFFLTIFFAGRASYSIIETGTVASAKWHRERSARPFTTSTIFGVDSPCQLLLSSQTEQGVVQGWLRPGRGGGWVEGNVKAQQATSTNATEQGVACNARRAPRGGVTYLISTFAMPSPRFVAQWRRRGYSHQVCAKTRKKTRTSSFVRVSRRRWTRTCRTSSARAMVRPQIFLSSPSQ